MALRVAAAVAIAIVAAGSWPTHADEGDPKAQARAHFRAGTAFYEAGDYDRAIEQYLEAYDRLSSPELLFNLGQAYRLKRDAKNAAHYYRLYLDQKPIGPVSDAAREHLLEIEAESPPTAPAVEVPGPAPTPTPSPPANTPAIARTALPSPANPVVTAPVSVRKRSLWRRPWIWGVIGGVAAAGIVVGVGVGVGTAQRIQPTDGVVHF
jgi:iron complex outermembrane receptor protein